MNEFWFETGVTYVNWSIMPFTVYLDGIPFQRISDVEKALIKRIAPKPEDDKR